MTSLVALPPAPAGGRDYGELSQLVRKTGLLRRRDGYYAVEITLNVLAFAGGWVAFFHVGDSWWQLFLALFFAVMFAQLSFIGHDAGHKQIFRSGRVNDVVGFWHGGMVGLSYASWGVTAHPPPREPQPRERRPDIQIPAIAFTAVQARERRGFLRWMVKYQAFLFFPLLVFEGFSLHVSSVKALWRRDLRSRSVECLQGMFVRARAGWARRAGGGRLAANPSGSRGCVPGRLSSLCAGRAGLAAARGPGRRPMASLARPVTSWARRSPPTVRAGPRPRYCARGKLAETTLQRWQQIHALLEAGVGLLDCSRRLGLAMNTVKRYARAATPERTQRVPKYRACMVDPYRDHLRTRREQEPGVGATGLLAEIRAMGYNGSHNLLVRYLNQERHLDDQPHLSPRRAARLMLTRPENLTERQHERLEPLTAACPEMKALASIVRSFAALLAPSKDNPALLAEWTAAAREAGLPHVHSFTRGINQDIDAVTAAITLKHHNGRTEDVNTKTKLLKRQMYGRAGLALLRHRILLG